MTIPVAKPTLPAFDQFAALAQDIFDRRYVSNFSKYCRLMEDRASQMLGADMLSVASCDIGMTLAWRALGLSHGEVIVPSFTFASTINALVWNGLTPVFADIDPDTLCLAPDAVRALITPRTVAIAAMHCFGEPVSPDIDVIAADNGLALFFDAAHAIGTTVSGSSLAGRGDVSVYSLSGTKVVTAGEGGLITFARPDIRDRFLELRGYGFVGDYNAKAPGLNGKISEMNAAMGYLSLDLLDSMILERARVAQRYRDRLAHLPTLRFQPAPAPGDTRSYKDFVIVFADQTLRDAVEQALADQQIGSKRYFFPAHRMDAYRTLARVAPLDVTEDIYGRALCVPMFSDLSDADIDRIADIIETVATS
ncbi:DegT/DnrJ/EryC1/StrS family aminotransferase (plasmid) [Rhodobacteraceae bacterium M382]|nr:DegT/DnrJ/EryC1/StrS family aminotransferase [Rhodobacteraceae bacterium M382]